jgi:hypothetical protein
MLENCSNQPFVVVLSGFKLQGGDMFVDDIATYVSLNWLEISKFPFPHPYWWTTHMQKISPLSIWKRSNEHWRKLCQYQDLQKFSLASEHLYTAINNSGRFLNTFQDLDAPEKLKDISGNPLS